MITRKKNLIKTKGNKISYSLSQAYEIYKEHSLEVLVISILTGFNFLPLFLLGMKKTS